MHGVCKKHRKYRQNSLVPDGFCLLVLVIFVALFSGMLHLGYACLISGFCWAILGYVSAMLAFVGHELGPYWLYFWAH